MRSVDPMVLLHGLGVDHRMWHLQVPVLQTLGPVWAPDLPGFGWEPPSPPEARTPEFLADRVAAGIEERWPDRRVAVAGYSMGGTVALLLALRHPRLVSRLVLACSPASWTLGWRRVLPLLLRGGLARVSMELFELTVLAAYLYFCPDRSLRPVVRDMIARAHRGTMADLCRVLSRRDLRPELARVVVPALVVSGTRDHWLSARHAGEMAGALPNGRLRVFAGAGHVLCLSRAGEFAEALASFFSTDARAA